MSVTDWWIPRSNSHLSSGRGTIDKKRFCTGSEVSIAASEQDSETRKDLLLSN